MTKWMKINYEIAAMHAAERDLERNISLLSDADDDEVGLILAYAVFYKFLLGRSMAIPNGLFDTHEPRDEAKCKFFQTELSQIIRKKYKNREYADAEGLNVLLSTSMAIKFRELRDLGVVMWIELNRGKHYARSYIPVLMMSEGLCFDERDFDSVFMAPPGLEA